MIPEALSQTQKLSLGSLKPCPRAFKHIQALPKCLKALHFLLFFSHLCICPRIDGLALSESKTERAQSCGALASDASLILGHAIGESHRPKNQAKYLHRRSSLGGWRTLWHLRVNHILRGRSDNRES